LTLLNGVLEEVEHVGAESIGRVNALLLDVVKTLQI
jgi:hypothetical protein